MRASRRLVSAFLAGAMLAGLAVTATGDGGPISTGCVIRLYASGPEIYDNRWHRCTGANSVTVRANGDLYIRSSHSTAVISVIADTDESLVARGILAGASGGVSWTAVRFYSTRTGKRVRADSSAVTCDNCNVWMHWDHERE